MVEVSLDFFHILSGLYYLIVPTLGILLHSFIQYCSWSQRKRLTAFTCLCMVKSLAALVFCIVFVLWAAPVCLIGRQFIWSNLFLEKFLYSIIHICIGYVHVIQFLSTMNRLIAVYSFLLYQRVFSMQNVKVLKTKTPNTSQKMAIFTLIPASWMIPYYFWDLRPFFDDYFLDWDVDIKVAVHPTTIESYLIWTLMGTSCCLDLASFLKIMCDTHLNTAISTAEASRRRNLNKRILFQTVTEEMLFVLDNIVFQAFGSVSISREQIFLGSTLTWVLSYVLNGLVIILFTEEMRKILMRRGRISTSTTSVKPNFSHTAINSK